MTALTPLHVEAGEHDGTKMPDRCMEMKAEHAKMNADAKAQDVALAAEVARMNNAKGAEKSTIMAGIVTTLVAQRTEMHVKAEAMQGKMMSHMSGHMQTGKDSMGQCPMTKITADVNESPNQRNGLDKN
ncbi:MAG: hypothetical protein H7Y06_07520 [Opitutaceae bacterium]|nr:hypothetical protein [Opitutaceae bacterium]